MHVHYRPAADVLDRLCQVDFVAVVGPTSVGKTTSIKAAIAANPQLHMLVAGVSRAPRPDEQDGVDFHFESKADMEARVNQNGYATVVTGVSGDLYTTAPEDYPIGKTVLMATLAESVPMFRALPYHSMRTICVLPPSFEEWQRRLKSHGFAPTQMKRRMAEAKRSLQFAFGDAQARFVISETVAQSGDDLATLALGRPLSERLEADQLRAPELVRILLDQLAA